MKECYLLSKRIDMKRTGAIALLSATLLMLPPVFAETPNPKDAEELNAVIKELQAQQIKIAGNQAKIDEKLVVLADTIREARIFSSRGGR